MANVKECVSKRLGELLPNLPILNFIPNHSQLNEQIKQQSALSIWQWLETQLGI